MCPFATGLFHRTKWDSCPTPVAGPAGAWLGIVCADVGASSLGRPGRVWGPRGRSQDQSGVEAAEEVSEYQPRYRKRMPP